MAVDELLLYFLVAPAAGYGLSAILLRWTMGNIAARQLGFLREPGVTPKFLVFLVLPLTPVIFGLVVFSLLQDAATDPISDRVVRSLGVTFGLSAVLTALSEVWLVLRRGAMAYRGETFARVLILAVVPETVIVFTLVVALQVEAFVVRRPTEPPLTATEAEGLVRACQYMAVGAFGAPIAALLANRVATLDRKTFVRAIVMATGGTVLTVMGLVLALLEIARL